MKFTKAIEVNDFLRTVESCEGEVWLESPNGDRFVLKSVFSRYIAMSALLTEKAEDLELFCQLPEDRAKFYKYFHEHPGVN
jgi:hypothetical protein